MEEQKNNQQKDNKEQSQQSTAPASAGQKDQKQAQKQDEPHKNHGIPEDEEEGSRHGGLRGGENFRKNMGCGG